jgi:copper homeostasis protein
MSDPPTCMQATARHSTVAAALPAAPPAPLAQDLSEGRSRPEAAGPQSVPTAAHPAPAVKFELCVDSLDSARTGIEAGADALELCACLGLGGVTPSLGLVLSVAALCRQAKPGLRVLVRARAGDFVYSPGEVEVMLCDIARFKLVNEVKGIVTGVLRRDGGVDEPQMRRLLDAARPLPVTFHRAIDVCADPLEALRQCHALGVGRILTSGGAGQALAGVERIRLLAERARALGVAVAAGGGVDASNALAIVLATGCDELHGSCRGGNIEPPPPDFLAARAAALGFHGTGGGQADPALVRMLAKACREVAAAGVSSET